jgi:diguanylate cyclase (GGDEF)-like protein
MQLRHLACRAEPPLLVRPAADGSACADDGERRPNAEAILADIDELPYEWDLLTDGLAWGDNLAKVLGSLASVDLSTGRAFGARLAPESSTSRYDAVMKSQETDAGAGVRYQIVYALTQPREAGVRGAIWLEDDGCWFGGPDGRPALAHGVVRVITERHREERRLARQSQYDPLTGVLCRAQLGERAQRMLETAERERKSFAILLVALENLFALNRTYGYGAGDEVIAGLAARLAQNLRATDLIGRHAGNKFAVVLYECDAEQAQAAAMRLIEAAAAPIETSAGAVPTRIRIGGVIAPREGRSVQALCQHAEEALDVARQRGGARYVAYSAALGREDQRLRALKIADNIMAALSEQRVELAFQPIVDAKDELPAFFEALLRVRLPDGSLVSPGSILPIAEKVGLVRLLDERVLELALARLNEKPALRLSINASLASILDPEWLERLSRGVAATDGLAERLTVEITETTVIDDLEATSRVIASCKRLGVKVAMDDFGAGHTSFRNLRALEFDLVKIDGAFVQNIPKSADDRFFVRTLINLAHHLGLRIVAEWVEDMETAKLLREWGVDYFQGSLFGKAGPQHEPCVEAAALR